MPEPRDNDPPESRHSNSPPGVVKDLLCRDQGPSDQGSGTILPYSQQFRDNPLSEDARFNSGEARLSWRGDAELRSRFDPCVWRLIFNAADLRREVRRLDIAPW